MSIYKDGKLIAGGRQCMPLLSFMWADHVLNDASWLRADTFSWQSGAVYQAAHQHLANDVEEFSTATQNANLGEKEWVALAWNGRKLVALGEDGYVSTSTDGLIWTTAEKLLGTLLWQDLVWNGTKFVALSSGGYVATSTDGTTWTQTKIDNLGNKLWYPLAWDGTKFVALSVTGYVSTSTDGVNWVSATQNANLGNNGWLGLAWDGTKFVALGRRGYVSTSTDGTNWTAATQNADLGNNDWWRALAWDGTKFLALENTGYVSTSTDGVNWVSATQNANLGNNNWYALAWDGTKFVVLGQDGYVSIGNSNIQTETIAGVTVTYYQADDGHKICPASEESNVSAIYNATGVAWYYVLDTTNQRFKLPRTKFGVTGLRDTVGNYVAPALPNHAHNVTYRDASTTGGSLNGVGAGNVYFGNRTVASTGVSNNSVYQDGATVQPPATQMYLYFYVGNFTQTALENTAGLNAELFNGKADLSTVAHVVTEFQAPTSANGYTWYRKYADGWVEQGGEVSYGTTAITFPVIMSSSNYSVKLTQVDGSVAGTVWLSATRATVGLTVYYDRYNRNTTSIAWQVSGMAAN